jgi:sugar transferase EpsL
MKGRVKRLTDVLGAAVALLLAGPVIALTAVLVRVSCGSPVLFRQTRTGLHGRLFILYKFRTMRPGEPGEPDEVRLTRFGRLLRSTSLDELPQLVNVLRGDMSLVGPRPLLPQYLGRYSPEQMRRHEVRPGITGLVQVSGRNGLSWREKFALDIWYIDHWSLATDLWILWRTIVTVVRRSGISEAGEATMSEFLGD